MTRHRWLPVVVAVAALIVVGLAAHGTGVQWREGELPFQMEGTREPPALAPQPEELPPTQEMPEEVRDDASLPSWISWLALAILVGVPVSLLLVFLARRLMWWLVDTEVREARPEPEPEHLHRDIALVERAVAAGLAEIDLGADPRSAIIACWVHFEGAGERVGIPREPSDTPSDLVRKLLQHHELDGESLKRLSEAYLLARYSPHAVGEADRDRARDALVDLQRQLGVRERR
ncbi:DUF4129 domain-containing protein [Glycomyces sp. L485]|uniref:DUF4129 domain-containing protein n=1 Tax=Glycomyces sp. L485 TaxID=2909235 RepID=UPI001F4B3B93|nr:DUF4129 domain-containing protein [Glycomyces sp. L485]MCH7231240.1 DUF4129 domain-containing protein [Glycomyces sp. L485]